MCYSKDWVEEKRKQYEDGLICEMELKVLTGEGISNTLVNLCKLCQLQTGCKIME